MLATKRYEYLPFHLILMHPEIINHRPLDERKVSHYESDILQNGLLEPLVVWEKQNSEYYLVGGFHRMAAIRAIREKKPGYFDYVDVRVVGGELDEMKALNLKLNADRLDAKITDFFDAVMYLTNEGWPRGKIADFLDRSITWVEEIIRYAPVMDGRIRKMIEEGKLSWNRAKSICRAVLDAPVGVKREEVLENALHALDSGARAQAKKKPLTFKKAKARLFEGLKKNPAASYAVRAGDILSLLLVLEGKYFEEAHLERVRKTFPELLE